MSWPLPHEINEAVQTPGLSFADPDLRAGEPVAGPGGVPLPRSGNFADVYHFRGPDGREWAVKCFTRPVAGLDERYSAVDRHLARANLPFTVGFTFLRDGLKVRDQWYPAVKMQWVEGQPVNVLVRENIGRASVLESLLSLWVRLCRRLRETGMAHCDLQHGNVLLVPGTAKGALGLKLVDYDGMFVPELAGKPTGETGHPSYQHPERAARNVYSADLDRFPHLVVATAIRGLMVGGQGLWDRYDNGDNLLFTEADFKAPAKSRLMRELWDSGDPFTTGLVAHLALACTKPLASTPWLDLLMPEGRPPMLTPSQERQAAEVLGLAAPVAAAPVPAAPVAAAAPVAPAAPVAAPVENKFDFSGAERLAEDEDDRPRARPRRREPAKKAGAGALPWVLAGVGGLLLAGGGVAAAVFMLGGKKEVATAVTHTAPTEPRHATPTPQAGGPKDHAGEPSPPPQPITQPPDPLPPPAPAGPKMTLKRMWAVQPGRGGKSGVRPVRFNPEGTLLVTALEDKPGTALTLDPASGMLVGQYTNHQNAAVAAPGSGDRVFSVGSGEPAIICWDGKRSRDISKVPLPGAGAAYTNITVGAANKYALLETAGDCTVLDLEAREEVKGFGALKPGAVLLSRDGEKLLALDGGKFTLWQIDGRKPILTAPLPGAARLLAWSPDGSRAAAAGGDGRVRVVELATGNATPARNVADAAGAAFTADGSVLAVVGKNEQTRGQRLIVYRAPGWGSFYALDSPTAPPFTGVDFAPTAPHLVATRQDGTVIRFDLTEGTDGPTTVPAVSPAAAGGQLAAAWQKEGAELGGAVRSLRLSPDGRTAFVTVFQPGPGPGPMPLNVLGFDAQTGAQQFRAAIGNARDAVAVPAPNDRVLVLANRDVMKAEIRTHAARTGTMTGPPIEVDGQLPNTPVTVALSPDGRYLASGGRSGNRPVVRVWDLVERTQVAELGPGQFVYALWFAPGPGGPVLSVARPNKVERYPVPAFRNPTETALPPVTGRWTLAGLGDRDRLVRLTFDQANQPQELRVFSAADGSERPLAGKFGTRVRAAAAGERVVAVEPGRVVVFDARSGQPVQEARPPEPLASLAVAADGTAVLASTPGGRVLLLKVPPAGVMVASANPTPTPNPSPNPSPNPAPAARKPIPSDEDVAAKVKLIRGDIFKAQYAVKTPAGQQTLAQELLKYADQTADDPAAQYALYQEVMRLGAELKDPALVVRAAEGMGQRFEADRFALSAAGLDKLLAAGPGGGGARALAEACEEEGEAAAEAEQYDAAVRLMATANSAFQRAGSVLAARQTDTRAASLKKLRARYGDVQKALAVLKERPGDPDAAAVVGRFRAFGQGKWDEGLKLLAKSGNPTLKALAEQDLAAAGQSPPDVKAGDRWAEAAPKAPEEDRPAYLARARYWYARALTGQTGLSRLQVEKKMTFTAGGAEYRPGLVAEWYLDRRPPRKVFARTDAGIDFNGGEFAANTEEKQTTRVLVHWVGALVAPVPGRYKLTLTTQDPVTVRVDGRPVITVTREGMRGRTVREAAVVLGERPVPLEVEWNGLSFEPSKVKLTWVPPGGSEEPIPAEALFHDKKTEALLKYR